MPPAATSHQDIYHQAASSSLSSASASTYHHHHHLPDYMMLLGRDEKHGKQQEPSIDQESKQQVSRDDATQTITIRQSHNNSGRPQVDVDGQNEDVSLSSSVPNLKSRKQLSLLNEAATAATASQCCWHKLQEQETYYDTYLLPNRMFKSEKGASGAQRSANDDNSPILFMKKSQPSSRDTIDFLQSSLFYQAEDEDVDDYEYEEEEEDDDECDDVNGPLDHSKPLVFTQDNLSASSTPSDIHLIGSSASSSSPAAYNFQKRRHSQNPNLSSANTTTTTTCKQMKEQQSHQQLNQHQNHQHYLTIEELKLTLNSCWLCGCNWQEDHVSLDCPECGGYAMSRPCPNCDGECRSIWTRNITKTHDSHKATWLGQCSRLADPPASSKLDSHHLNHHNHHYHHLQTTTSSTSSSNCCNSSGGGSSSSSSNKQSASNNTHLLLASSSSCCSSQPSSASSSDCDEEEADEQLVVLGKQ